MSIETLRVVRRNRVLEVSPLDGRGIELDMTMFGRGFSVAGGREIDAAIRLRETDPIRLWDLADALSCPEILHPVHKDVRISPFGDDSKFWVQIRWEGWHENELNLPEYSRPELAELLVMLNSLEKRAKDLKDKGARLLRRHGKNGPGQASEDFYRKAAQLLVDVFSEIMPVNPWVLRGFLPTPFRRLTIGRFKNNDYLSIRLSPSEARRLAKFTALCSGVHGPA